MIEQTKPKEVVMTELREYTALGKINFVRMGALASFIITVAVAVLFIGQASLSSANPRLEAALFLEDVSGNIFLLNATQWMVAVIAILSVPFFLGLYYGLRRWSEDYMRVFLVAAIIGVVLQSVVMIAAATAAGYVVPAWTQAGDEATRAMLLSDFRVLAWLSDASLSMFHVVSAGVLLIGSFVMLRTGSSWWRIVAWLGIVCGIASFLSVFVLASEGFDIAMMVTAITVFLWYPAAGIGLWRLQGTEMSR